MPELPEVVVTLRGVIPHILGRCSGGRSAGVPPALAGIAGAVRTTLRNAIVGRATAWQVPVISFSTGPSDDSLGYVGESQNRYG